MAKITITGPDGKETVVNGTYDEKTRIVSGDNKKIYVSPHDRVEVSDCFIATEIYGNPNHQNVITLRRFRDQVIIPSGHLGCLFVKYYYKFGPYIAYTLHYLPFLKLPVRKFLDLLTKKCCNISAAPNGE